VGRWLAQALGWTYCDRELLHQAAAVEHVPDSRLEELDERPLPVLGRLRPHPPHERYWHGLSRVVRAYAARGNVVFVGRGTRFLLGYAPNVLHLGLVAPRGWRAAQGTRYDGLRFTEALDRCERMDAARERFLRCFFGKDATRPWQYDLVAN